MTGAGNQEVEARAPRTSGAFVRIAPFVWLAVATALLLAPVFAHGCHSADVDHEPLLLPFRTFHQRSKTLSPLKRTGFHHHYTFQLRQIRSMRQLFILLPRRHYRHLRSRIPQHVSNLLRCQRRIQRNIHATNRERR